MTTMEGGMICVNNKTDADHIRVMRSHGWARDIESDIFVSGPKITDKRYEFHNWGFNLRPTEIQAGFGIRQIEKLPSFNKKESRFHQKYFLSYINMTFSSKSKYFMNQLLLGLEFQLY